jgi:hypothetical protein
VESSVELGVAAGDLQTFIAIVSVATNTIVIVRRSNMLLPLRCRPQPLIDPQIAPIIAD